MSKDVYMNYMNMKYMLILLRSIKLSAVVYFFFTETNELCIDIDGKIKCTSPTLDTGLVFIWVSMGRERGRVPVMTSIVFWRG